MGVICSVICDGECRMPPFQVYALSHQSLNYIASSAVRVQGAMIISPVTKLESHYFLPCHTQCHVGTILEYRMGGPAVLIAMATFVVLMFLLKGVLPMKCRARFGLRF
jgi:hypothetical protein